MNAIGLVVDLAFRGDGNVAVQKSAIARECDRRGWSLIGTHESSTVLQGGIPPDLASILGRDATALVVANLAALTGRPPSFPAALVARSRQQGWDLVVIDVGIDTSDPIRRRVAYYRAELGLRTLPQTSRPLPPATMRERVAGEADARTFELRGLMDTEAFERALSTMGLRYRDFAHVYDFGCGCGRILRHLHPKAVEARISASDTDEAAVAWVSSHFPEVDARTNPPLPPLPFENAGFDLVLGYSVFTHLDERYQDAWLAELARVTAPGGVVLLTVNGAISWRWHREIPKAGIALLPEDGFQELDRQLRREGFLYFREDNWAKQFPDYYHTTFHLPEYVRRHWAGEGFEVVEVLEGGAWPVNDMVVLRRGQR